MILVFHHFVVVLEGEAEGFAVVGVEIVGLKLRLLRYPRAKSTREQYDFH